MFNNELFQNYANIEHFQDGSEDPIANAEQDVMKAQQALAQAQQAPTGNNVNGICDTIRQAANQCEAREASQPSGDMPPSSGDMPPSSGDMAQQSRDMAQQSGDMPPSSGDMAQQSRDMAQQSRDMAQQSGDMPPSSGDMSPSSGDMAQPSGDMAQQSGDMDDMPSSMEQFQSNNGLKMVVDNNNMKLLLQGVLYACVFYLLSHPDTLRFVTKNVSQLNATNTHVVMSVVFVGCYMLLSTYL